MGIAKSIIAGLVFLAATVGIGCGGYAQIGAGFTDNLTKFAGRASGQAQYQMGGGTNPNLMPDGMLRLRVGGDVQELGVGAGICVRGTGPGVSPFARAGITALQIGATDGRFSIGLFGPFLEAGVAFDIGKLPDAIRRVTSYFIALHGGIGYDVRFTSQPNEGYWLVALAFGWRFGIRAR
ncbi:MAG: hypothetical protein HYY84_03085 [Deltaproteobacteria bacterium]|nr:hypothetical protein [Deltaproteobacteria bacterium]